MIRLPRPASIAALAGLCVLLLAAPAAGRAGGDQARTDPFWLGPEYAGLALTHATRNPEGSSLTYEDCGVPAAVDCSAWVNVQTRSACARNPIGLDVVPRKIFALRGGGIAAAYEPRGVDVGTGALTATVYTEEDRMDGALAALRRRSQPSPQPLPPPAYPRPVLRELKRATALVDHLHGIGAIAKATGLQPGDVWVRLRVAELLGPDALAGVPAPTMSVETMERLRQLAFRAQYDPARTAREEGILMAALRAKVRLVRGLAGAC